MLNFGKAFNPIKIYLHDMTEEEFSKILEALKEDLKFYNDMIREVSRDIIANGFSEYPVFIATEHEVKIGELILDMKDYARDFNIYAVTMEELIEKKLILEQNKEEFIRTYKNPKKFMSVLLLTSKAANFIFVPYQPRAKETDE